ncbi:DNA mismatch repair protein MutS [Putridiphycobacter roseus]|uniref:DNA mismatch repair protein MutS n=1 Tax=Putridiphycobacter roseus TaxID=2219161 RepID=A0A2W1N1F6_9FLAO|nr:DNA mismatch repair protein MutS [Putridiphycobacter roseus]PZE18087.1 DNA mismatch repair protein MutS [Putridiphycobacter roseus]
MEIDIQSKKDLEFDVVCDVLAGYCKSEKAKKLVKNLKYFEDIQALDNELKLIEEIQLVYHDNQLDFPHSNAEDIDDALKMLRIENGVLILDELIKVLNLCQGTKLLLRFSKQNQIQFPLVFKACMHITRIDDVLHIITKVLDPKKLQIKDSATQRLQAIREQQKSNFQAINKNFERLLRNYRGEELLGESEETHLDNRRLLTVLSQYKKRVPGKVHGISAKGNFTYVEPKENMPLNESQDQLRIEERHEIYLILENITNQLRSEKSNLEAFQRLLVRFDVFNAKVMLAESYQGVKPKIVNEQKIIWKAAKHPLLLRQNNSLNYPTEGQDIELDEEQRFLVISGPNAGGKSITLKTVGLLQMMLQCGLFIPIEPGGTCGQFKMILSDIGDNQSIENQLSTYSYRLNRMAFFLKVADKETLLLLDEFGSGSDPELGGALAEVFYEELYAKQTYAVITTHYTNIKILTATLAHAVNACMLFDTKKLSPLYQLSVGQPGSSFTFEVAEFNHIEKELIEKAKLKVSDNKIKIDGLTVALQKEKSKFKKINTEQFAANAKAKKQIDLFEKKLSQLTEKSQKQTQFFEQQNKFVNTGKKVYEMIQKYKKHKTNKALYEDLKKMVAIEKSKVLAKVNPVELNAKLKLPDLGKPIAKSKEKTPGSVDKPEPVKVVKKWKVGDQVKLKQQNKTGVIQEINGKKIKVMIGNFIFSTQLSEIE